MFPNKSFILERLYTSLRKLAKSHRYQLLYSQYKEIGTAIFANTSNFTNLQLTFLSYITFYASLNMSIYMNEVGEIVLEDEIYEDAFMLYKGRQKKQKKLTANKEYNAFKNKSVNRKQNNKPAHTHIVFSKPRIKR